MYLYRLFPVLESVSLNYVLVLVVSILVKLNSVIFLNLVEIVVVQKILSMLFIAKSLQSCPTLCDPIDGSPPGSPVLGSSRQEHWSGLPFLSPMHESESEVVQSFRTPTDPMDCGLPGSSIHGICQATTLEWVAISFSNA